MNIRIENLKKIYNDTTVLDIDHLEIASGELIGLVGNNGAGKTTLLRLMLDLIKADNGHVRMQCGDENVDVTETERWKDWTGAYVDEGFLIDYLTPDEYFDFIAKISNMSAQECAELLEKFHTFLAGEILGQKKLTSRPATSRRWASWRQCFCGPSCSSWTSLSTSSIRAAREP